MITEPLSDIDPVFLPDWGVVVIMISAASDELHGLFPLSQIPKELIIEGFEAAIGIEIRERGREGICDIFNLLEDP